MTDSQIEDFTVQIEENVYRDAGAAVPVSVRGRIVTILTRQPRMRVIVQVTKPPGTTYASRVGAVESSRFSHRETLGGGHPLNSLFQESNGFAVAFATSYSFCYFVWVNASPNTTSKT